MKPLIERKSWGEFRESGMLWLVNTMLHLFGWAIAIEGNECYPIRTSFRGFSVETNDKGYKNVTLYLKDNIDGLLDDVNNKNEGEF
jgi:hypothetical protein